MDNQTLAPEEQKPEAPRDAIVPAGTGADSAEATVIGEETHGRLASAAAPGENSAPAEDRELSPEEIDGIIDQLRAAAIKRKGAFLKRREDGDFDMDNREGCSWKKAEAALRADPAALKTISGWKGVVTIRPIYGNVFVCLNEEICPVRHRKPQPLRSVRSYLRQEKSVRVKVDWDSR
ncbi:MAG: hypothetical protein WC651_01175 [Candidatus Gracilibacteria bacterium]|jgi:hypothetical protein